MANVQLANPAGVPVGGALGPQQGGAQHVPPNFLPFGIHPAGRYETSRVVKHTPARCYEGYTRYSARHHNGGALWCWQKNGLWREEASFEYEKNRVSCFFRAVAWLVTRQQNADLYQQMVATATGLRAPVTLMQAVVIVNLMGWNLAIYTYDAYGNCHLVRPAGPGPFKALVFVMFDDNHDFAPHWLPCTSIRARDRIAMTFEDYDSACPGGALRPELRHVHEFVEERIRLMPSQPVDEGGDAVPPVGPHTLAYPTEEFKMSVCGYVCHNTPPVRNGPGAEGLAGRLGTPAALPQ
jgi:hypothetical protein